jgi:hypothetical protein
VRQPFAWWRAQTSPTSHAGDLEDLRAREDRSVELSRISAGTSSARIIDAPAGEHPEAECHQVLPGLRLLARLGRTPKSDR